jgi:hypothetical protein
VVATQGRQLSMEIHGVEVLLAREDLWPNPRWAPDPAVSTLEVQSGEGQAVLLLNRDAYLHGCVLPYPLMVHSGSAPWIIVRIALFFLDHQCRLGDWVFRIMCIKGMSN